MALARHTMDDGEGLRLRVATFNVRNTTDRYAERRPMLVDALRGFRAALVGLQEVSFQVSVPGVAHGGSQAVALVAEAIGEEVGSEYAQGVASGAGAAGHGTGEAGGDTAVATAGDTSPDGVDHPKPVADGGVGAQSDGGGDAGTSAGTGAGAGAGAGGDRSGEVAGAGNHAAKSARAATVYHAATKTPFPQPAGNPTFRIDGNALYVQVEAPHTVTRHEALVLSEVRSAHRVLLTLPGGDGAAAGGCTRVWFANTHLHHEVGDDAHARLRLQQSEAVCKWMAPCVAAGDIVVIVGDFNAPPAEPAYECFVRHGYRSAYTEVHGGEPDHTFPTGLQAPTMDTDPPVTTDYVWVSSGVRVVSAALEANKSLATDATLFPSDHMAVVADLVISPTSSATSAAS